MAKRMLIDAMHPEETRVVIVDNNQIFDFDFVSSSKKQLKGNIYLAKITRVEPSLQAAFVEYGGNKQGFLPFSEIHTDYYQIPASDRKRLMEESAREAETLEAAEDKPAGDGAQETALAENIESHADNLQELEQASGDLPLAPALEEIDITESDETDKAPMYSALENSDSSLESGIVSAPAGQQETSLAAEPAPNGAAVKTEENQPAESVETIQNEEEEEIRQNRQRRNSYLRRYKIQEVIRRGQVVLVQVIKEERGNKGASLTTYLSLPGRYCVLMPNSPKDGGISRKIASAEDRKRLKQISTELRLAAGMSVIIRTAGMDRTRAEIKRDYDYLVKLWNHIREDTLKSTAPALIYEESDIIKRSIRDQYTNDIEDILVEGDAGFGAAREFMKLLLPSHTPKVKQYKESTPLFYAHDIEDQLLSMHDPVVKLKSGGYIVINPTEALISIDVNSGRATGERNIEETATKTNIEAANEVARQLRLRDLAGLIVIDFIDMLESRNRRNVERTLKDALKLDRAKIQLGRISPFGLLEMSRQRLRPSISETNMVQCQHCEGRGYIRSNESMSIQIIRSLEKEASHGNWGTLRLIASQDIALHLLNSKRDTLRGIEHKYGVTIQVLIDGDLTASEFNLEKMRRPNSERGPSRRRQQLSEESLPIAAEDVLQQMEPLSEEEIASGDNEPFSPAGGNEEAGQSSRRNRRNRRGKRGGRARNRFSENDGAAETQSSQADTENSPENEPASDAVPGAGAQGEPSEMPSTEEDRQGRRPRRNRGGRGRRRWNDRGERKDRSHANESGGREESSQPWNEPINSNDNTLPAFTRQEAIPVNAPVQDVKVQAMSAPAIPDSTPRDPNAPPKKGWWQKMIELDE